MQEDYSKSNIRTSQIKYKLLRNNGGFKTIVADEELNPLFNIEGHYIFAEALALRIVASLNFQHGKFSFIDDYLDGV